MFVQLLRIMNVCLPFIKVNYLFVILYLETTTNIHKLTCVRKLGNLDEAVLT